MNHWISATTTETKNNQKNLTSRWPWTGACNATSWKSYSGCTWWRPAPGRRASSRWPGIHDILPKLDFIRSWDKILLLKFFPPGSCCHFQHWLHSALLPAHHPRRLPHLSRGCLLLSSYPTRRSLSFILILLISYSTGCSFILWLCFDHHCVLGCLLLCSYPTRKSPSLKLLLFWSPYHVVLGCPTPPPPLLGPVKQAISILYYPRPQ